MSGHNLESPTLLKSRLPGAVPLLLHSQPWSPRDFIDSIAAAGDRWVQIEPLVRDIPDADDLRIVCRLPASGAEVAVCAERLPWDSAFFGYGVAKLHGIYPMEPGRFDLAADYTAAVHTLVEFARSKGIAYLHAAVDTRDLPTSRALGAAGFTPLEVRGYYHRTVQNYRAVRRFPARMAGPDDVDRLIAVAQQAVNPYDRFHADPFIAPAEAARMMAAWVRASIVEGFADATFVLDDASRQAACLCTLKYQRGDWQRWGLRTTQMVFGAAYPPGADLIVKVFSEILHHLKAQGVEHCFFKTQIANRPVTRAAERLGYRLGGGEQVFRLVL
jgi:dTDP-4-amino-4,6-dideoxy-D-galactose acyltransferase